jgi:sugar transferase (PEP-CTERM system associated)
MIRIFNQYVSSKSVLLMALESCLIALAFFCGAWVRFWNQPLEFEFYTRLPDFAWQGLVAVMVFELCFYYCDLYNPQAVRTRNGEIICLGQSLGVSSLFLGLVYFIFPGLLMGRGVFLIGTALVAAFVTVNRLALDTAWKVAIPKQRILIVGARDLARKVALQLLERTDLNFELVGFVEPDPSGIQAGGSQVVGYPVLGPAASLEALSAAHRVSKIIVALEDRRGMLPTRDLVRLRVQGVRVEDATTTLANLTGRVSLETVQPSWFVFSEGFHRSRFTVGLKRALDLVLGAAGLLISAPLMLLVAIAIRLDSRGPVIFRQQRVGLGGRCFGLLKFRSMCADAEAGNGAQWAAEDDPRVTRVGRWIRKFRLDELPQFLNVIRGDMGFVGPRPERPEFVQVLRQRISYYDERHSMRPGLTGWAQVQYRYGGSATDALRKLEYDLFYLKHMSLVFDCIIILKTVRIVLTGSGAR